MGERMEKLAERCTCTTSISSMRSCKRHRLSVCTVAGAWLSVQAVGGSYKCLSKAGYQYTPKMDGDGIRRLILDTDVGVQFFFSFSFSFFFLIYFNSSCFGYSLPLPIIQRLYIKPPLRVHGPRPAKFFGRFPPHNRPSNEGAGQKPAAAILASAGLGSSEIQPRIQRC